MGGNPFAGMQDMKMDKQLGIKENSKGDLQKDQAVIRSSKAKAKPKAAARSGQYNFRGGKAAPMSRAQIAPLPMGMGNPGFGGVNH